jgi:hypothetical protein
MEAGAGFVLSKSHRTNAVEGLWQPHKPKQPQPVPRAGRRG